MMDKILFELRPKYNPKYSFFKYFFGFFLGVHFSEFVLANLNYSSYGDIMFGLDPKVFYLLLIVQNIILFIIVSLIVKQETKNRNSTSYKFYENGLEIETASKIVKLKYSAIQKVSVHSLELVSGVPLFSGKGAYDIKIFPIMQHGRKISRKYGYDDFSYSLYKIEHAYAFCAKINELIIDNSENVNEGNYDGQ